MENIATGTSGYAFLANFVFFVLDTDVLLVVISYFGCARLGSDGAIYAKNDRRGALSKGTDARGPPAR